MHTHIQYVMLPFWLLTARLTPVSVCLLWKALSCFIKTAAIKYKCVAQSEGLDFASKWSNAINPVCAKCPAHSKHQRARCFPQERPKTELKAEWILALDLKHVSKWMLQLPCKLLVKVSHISLKRDNVSVCLLLDSAAKKWPKKHPLLQV